MPGIYIARYMYARTPPHPTHTHTHSLVLLVVHAGELPLITSHPEGLLCGAVQLGNIKQVRLFQQQHTAARHLHTTTRPTKACQTYAHKQTGEACATYTAACDSPWHIMPTVLTLTDNFPQDNGQDTARLRESCCSCAWSTLVQHQLVCHPHSRQTETHMVRVLLAA